MPKTYDLPSQDVLDLLDQVMKEHHARLVDVGVKIGVLMVHAPVDDDGNIKGFALTGHAGAQAAAMVKTVPLKDRVTKRYDVELLIDADNWPKLPLASQVALLDHELTHISPTFKVDDLHRPLVKMRDEDFIVWGFFEVVQRHGAAALEHKSLKRLIHDHGEQLMLDMPFVPTPGEDGGARIAKTFVDKMRDALGAAGSVTITGSDGEGTKITQTGVEAVTA